MLKVVKYKAEEISYQDTGKGTTVVLLHGFCLDNSIWQPVIKDLAKQYRIIAPDLPGYGVSKQFKNKISLALYTDLIHEILQTANIALCVMIGHSMGGYVALDFAKKYPKKLAGLGLFHSNIYADAGDRVINRNKAIEFIKKHGSKHFIHELIPILFHEEYKNQHPEIIDQYIQKALMYKEDVIIQSLETMRDRASNEEFIKTLKIPLHNIIGKYDTTYSMENALQQSYLATITQLEIMETGHMGMLEDALNSTKSISEFISLCEISIN